MTENLPHDETNFTNLPIPSFGEPEDTSSSPKEKKPHKLRGRPRPPEVRAKISASLKGKPKTGTPWLRGRFGRDHPSFVHGKGNETREYNHTLHAAWKQGVLRASNFRCFITHATDNLECHHLIGWWNESTRYEITNGIAISAEIHKAFHKIYGQGNNFAIQFEEFCQEHYNITDFPWRHGNHKPSFTVEQELDLIHDLLEKNQKGFSELVESRKHEIKAGTFINNQSRLELRCTKHSHTQEVKAGNYKKAKFGLSCCASQKQSETVAKANTQRKKKETSDGSLDESIPD